jgi:hypothetical protein
MPDEKEEKPVRGPITEDTSVISGVDEKTGASVTRPKNLDGKVEEGVTATDPNERRKPQKPQ